MASDFSGERRCAARFPLKVPLSYCEPTSQQAIYAQSQDISNEGLSFIADKEIPPGLHLDIYLHMPDTGEEIYRRARAIWSKALAYGKYRVGVRLESEKLKAIELALRIINMRRTL